MRRAAGGLAVGALLVFGGLIVFLTKTEPKGSAKESPTPQRDAASRDITDPVVENAVLPRPLPSGILVLPDVRPTSGADGLVEQAIKLPKSEGRRIRELLRDALDIDPHNVRALRELGAARLEEEAYDEAIALAARCLVEVPGDADCSDIRNMAKGRSGRMDARETEECYQSRPKDFGCVQGRARSTPATWPGGYAQETAN